MPLYKKPANLKYTDMAIYVDANAYLPDHDVNKIYEYLYYLVYMLAVKQRFFYTQSDYESFSLMGATRVYRRLTNPRQFLEEGNSRKLKKIKSCLNYIKKVLYPFKVDYQREYFNQVISPDQVKLKDTSFLEEKIHDSVVSHNNIFLKTEMESYIGSINKTIKNYINILPHSEDSLELKYIYISCLLTLLNHVTWSNENIRKVRGKQLKPRAMSNLIDRIYQKEQESGVILFHLDASMSNYIAVIVNEIKALMRRELRLLIGENEPSESIIKSIITSSMNDYNGDIEN